MVEGLQYDNVWITKKIYDDAEIKFFEQFSKASVTPLAGEVAKARQLLIESRKVFKSQDSLGQEVDPEAFKFFEKKLIEFEKTLSDVICRISNLECRIGMVENSEKLPKNTNEINLPEKSCEYDDIDLFAVDSDDDNEDLVKVREERLAAYNAKKSKKPVIIAKSNVILDVKPWDDETDMKEMEKSVRNITMNGLLWGASKTVPLAYGIHKLQISCVVEDDKVSIDQLQDDITAIKDYVQSVDIAAFNKI